jgi:hypothetical protein
MMFNSQVDVLWVKPTIIATTRRYNFGAALSGVPSEFRATEFQTAPRCLSQEAFEIARDPPPSNMRLVLSTCEPTTRSSGGKKDTTSDRHDPNRVLLRVRNTTGAAYWSGIQKASVNEKPRWRTLVQRIADLLDEIPLVS